jgi:hypothetical protein
MNVLGVALGTVAGAVYSWFQFTEEVEKKALAAKSAETKVASAAVTPASTDIVHRHVAIGMPATSDASSAQPPAAQQQV